MMRYGIRAYRLPRAVLELEIARIAEMGVTLQLGSSVDDLDTAIREGGYDAAFLAIGAQLSKRAYIPAGDSARILDALAVLRDVAGGAQPDLGRQVVVLGGGNTAMDVARTARRLGATDALVVYRLHAGEDAGPAGRARGGRGGRGSDTVALHDLLCGRRHGAGGTDAS